MIQPDFYYPAGYFKHPDGPLHFAASRTFEISWS